MTERIVFELNGKTRTVEVAPDTPLLYVLRNEIELNNPHFGCGLAQCGACTVHVDGAPTRSCSLPVSAVAGTKVTTLAGLGTPEKPHPLQAAFIAEQVPQRHLRPESPSRICCSEGWGVSRSKAAAVMIQPLRQ